LKEIQLNISKIIAFIVRKISFSEKCFAQQTFAVQSLNFIAD